MKGHFHMVQTKMADLALIFPINFDRSNPVCTETLLQIRKWLASMCPIVSVSRSHF